MFKSLINPVKHALVFVSGGNKPPIDMKGFLYGKYVPDGWMQ
jgi:hypothetical protein